jgi:predicted nucleotidyltransferase
MLIQSNIQKILEIIFKFPTTGFTIRELARLAKISPPTASSTIKNLEKIGLVEVKKEKVQYKVFGNLESEYYRDLKRIYNIFSLIELKNFLVKELNPNAMIIFGGYSKGEDIENSDIDIFVDTTIEKKMRLDEFEKKLNRKIHLITGNFKKLPEELKRNIINGTILWGTIEW